MGKLVLVGLILVAGAVRVEAGRPLQEATPASGTLEPEAASTPLRETGSYIRRYWHIPLYRVSLEIPDPQEVAARYRSVTGRSLEQPVWAELAAFLLDPRNHIEVRVSLQMLINLKGYNDESRCLRESLGRMGLTVDEHWQVKSAGDLQPQVSRLAEALIGLSADRPGLYYRDRRKGDVYVFSLDGRGGASLSYQPAAGNRAARPGQTDFSDYRVVAAFAGALLLPAAADEGASSSALLGSVRDAWAAVAAAEARCTAGEDRT